MAARVMGTAKSRVGLLAILAVAVVIAGCGGSGSKAKSSSSNRAAPSAQTTAVSTSADAFAWLHLGPPPAGWRSTGIPAGATFAYPPGWALIRGDSGTASAALLSASHAYVGYLNLTPHQGAETLSNWAHFRVAHNADEGDRNVRTLAATTGRRVGDHTVSCVIDSYTTAVRADYKEIACLLKGSRSTVVVVGATRPGSWSAVSPLLERAIASARA